MEKIEGFRCSSCGLPFPNKDDCASHEKGCLDLKSDTKVSFMDGDREVSGVVTDFKKAHKDGHDKDIAPEVFVRSAEAFRSANPCDGGWEKWIPWDRVARILS